MAVKSLEELGNVLQNRQNVIGELLTTLPERIAIEIISVSSNRVINDGLQNAKYSTNKLPAFFFEGKERRASGRAYLEKKKKDGEGVTWGEFRQAQGLRSDVVNLSYTNAMFRTIEPKRTEIHERKAVVYVGSSEPQFSYNVERYGNFLIPTENEMKDIQDNILYPAVEELLESIFT